METINYYINLWRKLPRKVDELEAAHMILCKRVAVCERDMHGNVDKEGYGQTSLLKRVAQIETEAKVDGWGFARMEAMEIRLAMIDTELKAKQKVITKRKAKK